MKSTSQYKAEKFWDKTAKTYDKEEEKDKRIHEQIIEQTKYYLKPSDTVLDLGCGTGFFSNEISGYVKKIEAIDFSSKMIEIAKAKAEKQKLQNIQFRHSTIFDTQLKLASFDVIACFYILHLLHNPKEVIKRILTLLRPNGFLISVTPCMGKKPLLGLLFSLLGKINMVPKISLFNQLDLERLITSEGFGILKNEALTQSSTEFFTVAKK